MNPKYFAGELPAGELPEGTAEKPLLVRVSSRFVLPPFHSRSRSTNEKRTRHSSLVRSRYGMGTPGMGMDRKETVRDCRGANLNKSKLGTSPILPFLTLKYVVQSRDLPIKSFSGELA